MQVGILAFVTGIGIVQQWERLPDQTEWLLIILITLVLSRLHLRLGCFLLLGVIWASIYANWRLADRLADHFQGQDVSVQGYIASLPRQQGSRINFEFIVTAAPTGVPERLRLNWYAPQMPVKGGQSWEMTVRLKRPHGLSNQGGFDYEAWLFANHLGATGYVRPKPLARQIEPQFEITRYQTQLRQQLSDSLDNAMPHSDWLGVVKALTIGSQDAITKQQWEIFRKTGTVHLMVISGTHIGLVAGLVFLLVRRIWIWTNILRVSPQNVAAIMAWLAALCYTALAGFSIPTQRALLMLTVGLWALIWQRNTAPLQVLLLALFVVVVFDPLAVLSVGLWLSFAAVFLLIYINVGRLGRGHSWSKTAKLHTAMAIGLAPFLIVFFQQVSVVAPVANWIAVPAIGLVIVPLVLLAAILALISPTLAGKLLCLVDQVLHYLNWVLKQMASWSLATVSCPAPSWYALLFAVLGILLLLAPKGIPGRYLSPFLLLPLVFGTVDKPKPGSVWLTLLDVGQGLATVIQTANHVLIYDTGAKYSEQSDMGQSVILPFLSYRGIGHIDRLMISHGENDHSGGAESLMTALTISDVYSSAAAWAQLANGHYCQAGQSWQWDDVKFEILSPGMASFDSENNNSCVLKISGYKRSILATGDIEREAENWLVKYYGPDLHSSVLIAPHHGSKTSSHSYFLDRVNPELILIPAGYLNRFGFPSKQVLQRYRERRIPFLTTGEKGAISVKIEGGIMQVESWRQNRMRYWMNDD